MSELIYRIDSTRILIEERGALRKRILYPSTLKQLAKESDLAPLQILIQAKRKSMPGVSPDTLPCQAIHIDLSFELLSLLKSTGRLFIGDKKIESVLETKISWEGESFGSEACRVEAFFSQKNSLKEMSWHAALPKHLVLAFGSVLFFAPVISHCLLKKPFFMFTSCSSPRVRNWADKPKFSRPTISINRKYLRFLKRWHGFCIKNG